jgi:hypothetical protein
MPRAYRARPRIVLLSSEAWTAAEGLAEAAGVTPIELIEIMLLDLRDHHAGGLTGSEPVPEPVHQPGVIPISRARRAQRRRPPPHG